MTSSSLFQAVIEPSAQAQNNDGAYLASHAALPDISEVDGAASADLPGGNGTPRWDYFGFNHTSWWGGDFEGLESAEALRQIKNLGVDTATIVPTHYLNGQQSHEIFATQKTEPLHCVAQAVADAKAVGLQVWLKPHLDLENGAWRGELDPANRSLFFQNYKDWILDYARLAQQENVEVLVIGTEIDRLIGETDRAAWLDIIASIRQVYTGKLTYAVNWDKPGEISFASELDFIGIDAYYPLTENRDATVEQLVHAWTNAPEVEAVSNLTGGRSIVEWLAQTSYAFDKPIVFTEVGYRSIDGNAALPYEWSEAGEVDLEEQARLYEAFLRVFGGFEPAAGDMSWFKGSQLWNCYARAEHNNDPTDTDYAVLHKPAEEMIRTYSAQLLEGNPAALAGGTLAADSDMIGFGPAPHGAVASVPEESGWDNSGLDSLHNGGDVHRLNHDLGLDNRPGADDRDALTGSAGSHGSFSEAPDPVASAAADTLTDFHPGEEQLNGLSVFNSNAVLAAEPRGMVDGEVISNQGNDLALNLNGLGSGKFGREPVNMEPTQLLPLIGLPDFATVNF